VDPTLGMDLSPSEQRALQAEKRAAWRKARLKSLEQVKDNKNNNVGTSHNGGT